MSDCMRQQVPLVDLGAQYATIREEIHDRIEDVLNSGQFVGGEWVERFEHEFSKFVGAEHAVGVGSGTAALELALKVSGIGPGHDVIVPANSFFATAEAVTNVSARPVFADVDPLTCHLDITSVERVFTDNTRAVIPVHLYGRAMDTTDLERFAALHGITIIEDAAQAHGAESSGVRVGGSGRLCCFSFYPGKNLGAYGDGGAITGNDPEQIALIRLLRDHGSPSKYQHSVVGTNSRLDAIQAAVLCTKLRYLSSWNDLRRQHANTYARAFAGSPVSAPEIPSACEHVFHLFVVRTRKRGALQQHLQQNGISSAIHYPTPLHLTQAYQHLGAPGRGTLPISETLSEEILSLPMYAEMSPEQLQHVIRTTLEFADPVEFTTITATAV
jgi:dTDP-4-amino-4,6-dideoxygalactose transaminase